MLFDLYVVFIFILYYGLLVNTITILSIFNYLHKTLDMLKYKCWYYDQAMKEGNEDKIRQMLPDKLPKDIQQLYDNGHK